MKKIEVVRSPLCINVVNFHNLDHTRHLSHEYNYIKNKLQGYRGSFIAGFDSVHNQHIGWLWVDLLRDVAKTYITIFIYLEDEHSNSEAD
jgi:hypothetical protein